MEIIKNKVKVALASSLLTLMMAVGTMAGVGTNGIENLSAPPTGAGTNTIAAQVDDASINNANSTGDTAITSTALNTEQEAAQVTGIIDARYAFQQAGPAVVTVVNNMEVTTRGRFGSSTQTAEALGSGVIISTDGYIVTNQHVVDSQQSLEVIFSDGTRVAATLIGEDAANDIAVIKVDVDVPAVANLGNSDALEPGQPVVAIGTALGDFQNTVTTGIISGLHRQLDGTTAATQDMIQTDAAINHGNSGGPLLDLEGNVIGINTAVVRSDPAAGDVAEGLGFAIPSNTVETIVNTLIAGYGTN